MACTITVTQAVSSGGNIIVTGTFVGTPGCTAPCVLTIDVQVNCLDANNVPISCQGFGAMLPGSTFWQASIPCNCVCGANNISIIAMASCVGPPMDPCNYTCSTTSPFVTTLLCCCPSATTTFALGTCTGTSQLVTFTTIVTIPDACTFCFRRNFGDGNFGGNYCFTGPGQFNLPVEQHNYTAPNSYTSNLDVIPPPLGCPTPISSVNVSVACGGCHGSVLIAALCRFFEWLFLLSMTVGLGIGFSQPCVPLTIAGVFFGAALIALIFYLILQCNKCVCDFWLKYWGIIFIAVGFVNIMYIPPACALVTGWAALTNAMIFFSIGFAILLLWYNNNKLSCPLKICDFWCAVAGMANISSATGIAIIAVVLINVFAGGVLTVGMFLSIGVIALIASIIAIGPLSNAPCLPNTPTCS